MHFAELEHVIVAAGQGRAPRGGALHNDGGPAILGNKVAHWLTKTNLEQTGYLRC